MTGLFGLAEVERARAVIDAWTDQLFQADVELDRMLANSQVLMLRGMIAAALADAYSDAYSDGYVAGIQRGKVDTVQRVMETLHDL